MFWKSTHTKVVFYHFAIVSLLLTTPNTFAQSTDVIKENGNVYPAYFSLSWMNEKLDGDDKPYVAIRNQINNKLRTKTLTRKTLTVYEASYKGKPKDPQLFFRWAYAIYVLPGNKQWRDQVRRLTTQYFWKIPSPSTFEYLRLRWLSQAIVGPFRGNDSRKIRECGERLLKRDANDYFVLYSLVDYSTPQNAVKYGQRMVKLRPNKKSAVATLAFARLQVFLETHTQKDADAAIATHRKLLNMIPKSDTKGRQDVIRTINHIRKVRARWAKKVP